MALIRKPWGSVLLLLALIVLLAGGVAGYLYAADYLPVRTFDSADWKARTEENVRVKMIESLKSRHELKGMRAAQIEALLGPPTETAYFANWDYVYWLGDGRGLFATDHEWLVLRFGPDGRVREWAVLHG